MSVAQPRIMLYSHDTYGLGHLRRTLSIATQFAQDFPTASQLIVTGSTVAGAFDVPNHSDIIKLPSLSKRRDGRYKARSLPLSLSQTIHWRQQMILQATIAFQPDLLLVDKSAAGVQDELLPTLRHLKTWCPETRLVLGMRDIEDSPNATKAEWDAGGIRHLHDEIYDCILLYGQREIFDPVVEYEMSVSAHGKLVSVGYLGRVEPALSEESIRNELKIGDRPLIVIAAGGGGDGFDLLKTYMDALKAENNVLSGAHTVMVTGPLMAKRKRALLRNQAQFENLTLLEFTPHLVSYMAAADLVVSMGGYNTVREALSLRTRLLVVPRTRPRVEQLIRAERLAGRDVLRFLIPDELTPQRLADEIQKSLSMPCPSVDLDFGGLENVSQVIASLLMGNLPTGWGLALKHDLPIMESMRR